MKIGMMESSPSRNLSKPSCYNLLFRDPFTHEARFVEAGLG